MLTEGVREQPERHGRSNCRLDCASRPSGLNLPGDNGRCMLTALQAVQLGRYGIRERRCLRGG